MHDHQPITRESLCVALNRMTGWQLAPRDVVLVYREWRWVAQLPGQRIAFVADTASARQRLARQRQLLQLYNTPQKSDQQLRWYTRCLNRIHPRRKNGEAAKPLYG